MFVGGGSFSGYSGPASIDKDGQCNLFWFGETRPATECFYLKDVPLYFEWIPASHGEEVVGAVKFRNVAFGRTHTGNGVFNYNIGNNELTAEGYEVLVYKPLRRPPSINNLKFRELFDIFKASQFASDH